VVADRFGTSAYGQINGIIAFLMTLTAALGLVAMAGVTARDTTYNSAMILVVLGSLLALVAIISLEVFSPATHSEVAVNTELQKTH
jgi:hypothetical protein